jgi:hypothetical protein
MTAETAKAETAMGSSAKDLLMDGCLRLRVRWHEGAAGTLLGGCGCERALKAPSDMPISDADKHESPRTRERVEKKELRATIPSETLTVTAPSLFFFFFSISMLCSIFSCSCYRHSRSRLARTRGQRLTGRPAAWAREKKPFSLTAYIYYQLYANRDGSLQPSFFIARASLSRIEAGDPNHALPPACRGGKGGRHPR